MAIAINAMTININNYLSDLDFECQKELTKIGYGTQEQLWAKFSGEVDKEKLVNNVEPVLYLYKQLFRLWAIEWKPSNIKKHKKFIERTTEQFIFRNLVYENQQPKRN